MMLESFITNIIIILNLTLIGGILPLIERKYLSLTQRRVGPNFTGYKGRFQFAADAIKIFLKQCALPTKANPLLFFFTSATILFLCFVLYFNIFWSTNLTYQDLEFNSLFLIMVSYLFNFYILVTALSTSNKYAVLSALRTVILMFGLELLIGILYLNMYTHLKSFNFSLALTFQSE